MPAAWQESEAVRQDTRVTTRVERADGWVDVEVTTHAWPSGIAGRARARLDLRHAKALHKKLGAAIVSAEKWQARQAEARRRAAGR